MATRQRWRHRYRGNSVINAALIIAKRATLIINRGAIAMNTPVTRRVTRASPRQYHALLRIASANCE